MYPERRVNYERQELVEFSEKSESLVMDYFEQHYSNLSARLSGEKEDSELAWYYAREMVVIVAYLHRFMGINYLEKY